MRTVDLDERVRERAYELWEQAGRPWGREHEFWAAASEQLEGNKGSDETPRRFVAR